MLNLNDVEKEINSLFYSKEELLNYINSLPVDFLIRNKSKILEIANCRLKKVFYEKYYADWDKELERYLNDPNSAINQDYYWK